MEELISIIIPVYKVEKYLDKCINSVLNQTYRNIEIILVDDGSPDKCGAMCDEYEKNDNRIKVIHKKNEGLSEARNAGIDIAKGKYITFVDSDDYVIDTYISFLYNLIKAKNADMSMGKHYIQYPKRTMNTGTGKKYDLNAKQALEMCLYSNDIDVSAWAKLYKAELFKEIRYPKERVFEDSATIYKLIDKSKKIAFESVPIYYYVIRENSIITKDFDHRMLDLIKSTEEMTQFTKRKYPELEKASNRRMMYAYLSTLTQMLRRNHIDPEIEKKLLKYIKEHSKEVLKDKHLPIRDRIALISIKFGTKFYKMIWRVYEKVTGRT